jgi:hypothetical protein
MSPVMARCDYFTKFLVLFFAGILAHTLSGGEVIGLNRFILLTGLISAILFLVRNVSLEGPQLALVILALQSAGHFLLGGADKTSDLRMSIAHLIAGTLSYRAVTHFDRFWELITELAQRLYIPSFIFLTFHTPLSISIWVERNTVHSLEFFSIIKYRGPPTKELS